MTVVTVDHADVAAIRAEAHYNVRFADFALDLYFRPGVTKKALIFSPGFLDRSQFAHPYFQRRKWLESFDACGICLADPTLDINPEVQIGWFVGTKKTHYLNVVADFLARLLASLGIRTESTLFFGSSAGGFASLAFAALIPGACAFAVNPQTNLLHFHSFKDLNILGKHCLGTTSAMSWEALYLQRIDLVTLMREAGNVPRGMIWQNKHDEFHLRRHLMPFLDQIGRLPGNHSFLVELASIEALGHNPPALPVLKGTFDTIISGWLQ